MEKNKKKKQLSFWLEGVCADRSVLCLVKDNYNYILEARLTNESTAPEGGEPHN